MTPPIENSSNLGLAEPKTTFKGLGRSVVGILCILVSCHRSKFLYEAAF